jgi:hypothetical protein
MNNISLPHLKCFRTKEPHAKIDTILTEHGSINQEYQLPLFREQDVVYYEIAHINMEETFYREGRNCSELLLTGFLLLLKSKLH